jgi:hypothetical protein
MEYCCQENAWCDERAMLKWVDKILKPYLANYPGKLVHLLLDDYSSHQTTSVYKSIQGIGCKVFSSYYRVVPQVKFKF